MGRIFLLTFVTEENFTSQDFCDTTAEILQCNPLLSAKDMSNADEQMQVTQAPEVEPLAAPAPGTVIVSTTTIDTIFTTVFGTRSADLTTAGTPTYTWAGPFSILANWPGLTTPQNTGNNSQMFCRFECRQMAPSTISP